MKIEVCDICYKKHNKKLTETTRYFSVKGNRALKISYCPECKKEIPKDIDEYVRFAYALDGIKVDDAMIKMLLKRA